RHGWATPPMTTTPPKQEEDNRGLDSEVTALRQLERDATIIKPADKGSAVVILDRGQYVKKAERQLDQEGNYRWLAQPTFQRTALLIRGVLDGLVTDGTLGPKQCAYLVPHEVTPGRPIKSDCGSETYGVSEWIDTYLQQLSVQTLALAQKG
uniref:Uncharacterized protein n=1 Tax=Salmo trutta TaxID=8032 RepID=A0A674B3Q3_SALTR